MMNDVNLVDLDENIRSRSVAESRRDLIGDPPLIYYKASVQKRQVPLSFMCGDSDIFSGRLTFFRSYGSLHAKITRTQHIYKTLNHQPQHIYKTHKHQNQHIYASILLCFYTHKNVISIQTY